MSIRPIWNNSQFQPLTTVLKNIIRDYQDGGGILLELCQNADDAGASKIEFVLDLRQHETQNILHKGLAEYQGISLLAYNNSIFTEKDFRSLRKIGDSEKKDELGSTGRFGRGFNSVYNWTDSPSIISGSSLLILDPHQTWSATPEVDNPGGPVYDFVKHSYEPEMRNQLSTFSSILKDFDSEFDGTIIRLPLRTGAQATKSKIKNKHTSEKDVKDVFSTFSAELAECLLFLKNLNSITLRIGDDVYARAKSEFEKLSPASAEPSTTKARKKRNKQNKHREKAAVNTAYQRVYIDKLDSSCKMDFVMNISLFRSDIPGPEQKFRYAISHILAQGPEDKELQAWAIRNKLFPWTAIAAPLNENNVMRGSLFNTLPLPIHTNHPVHIHGMFSITSDRVRIHSGGGGDRMTSRDSEARLGAKWNQWLFREYVPQTWVQNLEFLRGMNERGEFRFSDWDFWPAGSDEEWEEDGMMRVLGDVFQRVVGKGYKLLPTVCGTTERGQDVLFYLGDLGDYKQAFQDAGLAVVALPSDKVYELERLEPYQSLTPLRADTVRKRLTLEDDLSNLPLDSRMLLLYYVILDENFSEINLCKAPLIPIKDGTFESFSTYGRQGGPLFLARDKNELELFEKHTDAIDISKLSPGTVEMVQRNFDKFHEKTRISGWTVEGAASYCDKYFFGTLEHSGAEIIHAEGLDKFVDRLWQWISVECKPSLKSHSALQNLWLLPLMDRGYRKLNSTIPVLDVSRENGFSAFLRKTVDSRQLANGKGCALFTGHGVSSQTAEYLRLCGYVKDCEDIVALMGWLAANSGTFVDRLNDEEKSQLLGYLQGLSLNCYGDQKKFMGDTVSELRIFKEAMPSGVGGRDWISMNGVDHQHNPVKYVGIENVPVVLRTPGIVFIDIGNPDTNRLIRRLRMAECPRQKDFFEHYVVPEIANTTDYESRVPLIEYALQSFNILTEKCKVELSEIEIVQISGPTGLLLKCPRDTVDSGSISSLFFSDENRVASETFCRRYRYELLELGMVSLVNDEIVLERISVYGKPGRPQKDIAEKARQLIIDCANPPSLPEHIRPLRWIPAQSLDGNVRLCSANGCRDRRFESIVKYTMPLVDIPISKAWSACFGWDGPLPRHQILEQLRGSVEADDSAALEYLIKHEYISAEQFPELKKMKWVPSVTGDYYMAENIYLDDFTSLSPHFGTLDPRFQKHKRLFGKIGVQTAPSFRQYLPYARRGFQAEVAHQNPPVEVRRDGVCSYMVSPTAEILRRLRELQDTLAGKGALEQSDLEMALCIVKEVGKRHSKKNLREFKVPDKTGRMYAISEITTGDPGNKGTNLKILHPEISLDTAKKLNLPTFQDRYLELLNDTRYERGLENGGPKAVIGDVLRSYPVSSTFTEYLANAEDCGSATVIHWILDESDNYPKKDLLSPGLAKFQGPALFCYNNGKFSDGDFGEIMGIGDGSKRGDSSKIGRFGKGALTMYHWTSVPSFISGDYFVIFDPDQKYLPEQHTTKRPRAGMKVEIKEVRAQWPEQLRPFEGIEGFCKDSTSFPGTLFRFPLQTKGKVSILDATRHLEEYYEEANISLLFLKRIRSIAFFNKGSSNSDANWSVSLRAGPKTEKPGISCLKIIGEYPGFPSKMISREWCVISGRQDTIPTQFSRIRLVEGLEATYGLAALVSESPTDGFYARHFLGVPLRSSGYLELPVNLSVDMVFQSSQQPIQTTQEEEGPAWNKWILESGVVPLYLDLVQYLTQTSGTNGYRYWPGHQPRDAKTMSNIISIDFWAKVASSTHSLYAPDDMSSTLENTSSEHTPRTLSLNEATFNLLDTAAQRDFFSSLLSRLGVKNIVTPNEMIRNRLREIQPVSTITPRFLITPFHESPACSEKLLEVWVKEYNHSIEFFNQLLDFLINETPLSLLDGCTLLPLVNGTLGTFLAKATSPIYFLPVTSEEREILAISENRTIHPGIDSSIANRLISEGSLNIKRLQLGDIIELHEILDSEERDPQYRKDWLAKAWSYLRLRARSSPGMEQTHLAHLQDKPIYFGRVVGEPIGNYFFIRPSEFDSFAYPAILEPPKATTDETTVIESLKGLVLLDRSAFPWDSAQKEYMRGTAGAYRLLNSIRLLASKDRSPSISEYILRKMDPDSIAALRNIISPHIVLELLIKYPNSEESLKQLPLWPITSLGTHKIATEALLPPYESLSSLGIIGDIFIDANVAGQYSDQLVKLGAKKMTLDSFLRSHVGVSLDRQISADKMQYYEPLIEALSIVCPEEFSTYPLGIDGNKNFRMLCSLYSLDEPIFEAAFRDLEMTHFLHQDFRKLPSRQSLPLVKRITEDSYLACADSIQRRWKIMGTQDDQLIDDARTVFSYLCRNDQETQYWSPTTWEDLSEIQFVPVKTDFTNYPQHRIPVMERLLGGRNLAKITDTTTPSHINVAWSQYLASEKPICSFALGKLPTGDILVTEAALKHLIFLSGNRDNVLATQIQAYAEDIKAVYRHLRDNVGSVSDFSVAPANKIWFNVETLEIPEISTQVFRESWICSQDLRIGLEFDSPPLLKVRSFLTQYQELMHYCGVKKVQAPVIPDSSYVNTNHTSLILSGLRRLREESSTLDVKLVLGCQEFRAHRTVLCAMSRYWSQVFSGTEREYTFPASSTVKPETISALLNYIYTGEVLNIESGVISEDLTNILDQLYVSNEWDLYELKAELEARLCRRAKHWIRPEFVHRILGCAEGAKAEILAGICEQYISSNSGAFQ